jgi:LAO/AO transport system kinase
VLHFLSPATPGWQPEVLTCSALQPTGIEEVWIMLEKFRSETAMSGHWLERRLQQVQEGLLDATREQVLATMASSPAVVERLEARGRAVAAGTMTLRAAADDIARGFLSETLSRKERASGAESAGRSDGQKKTAPSFPGAVVSGSVG